MPIRGITKGEVIPASFSFGRRLGGRYNQSRIFEEDSAMAVSFDELRAKLEAQRDRLKADLAEMNSYPDSGMGYSNHQADDASEAFEQAAELAVRQNAERLLYQIERALYRMEEGTYGICRDCGKPIDYARLRAIPYSRYCIECASRHEEK
jgi:DnaK suppressor protein